MPTGAWRLTYSEAGTRVVREVGIVLKMFRGGREFGEIHGKSYRTPSRWTMGPLSGSLTYTCLENWSLRWSLRRRVRNTIPGREGNKSEMVK